MDVAATRAPELAEFAAISHLHTQTSKQQHCATRIGRKQRHNGLMTTMEGITSPCHMCYRHKTKGTKSNRVRALRWNHARTLEMVEYERERRLSTK